MALVFQAWPPTKTHIAIAKWGSLAAILIGAAYHLSNEYGVHIVVDGAQKPVVADATDPFAESIKSAYAADTDPQKAENVKKLAAVYAQPIPATVESYGQLWAWLRQSRAAALPPGAIPKTVATIEAEQIYDAKAARVQLDKVAKALGGAK